MFEPVRETNERRMTSPGTRATPRTLRSALAIFACALMVAAILPCFSPSGALADSRDDRLKQAARNIRRGEYEQADATYRALLAQNEADHDTRLKLSYTLLKRGRLRDAVEQARAVAFARPNSARAHALIGTALLRQGEFATAAAQLLYSYQQDSRDALAVAGLAEIELFENRVQSAYSAFRRAIDIDDDEPDFYRPYARACSRLELYSEAADALADFLRVAPPSDVKQRARIEGVIKFYKRLGNSKVNVAGGDEVSTVDFDLVGNRPYLNVMINGKGPLRFVLDTGASLSLISDAAAKKLGIKPLASGGQGRAVGGSGAFPLVYGLLDSVTIGRAKIERVPVYIRTVVQAPASPAAQRYDGYFGMAMLGRYIITVDYKNRSLTLDRRPAPDDDNAQRSDASVPVAIRTTRDGLASAEINLETSPQPLNFIVDTGASATVISKAVVKRDNMENLIIPDLKIQVVGAAGIDEGIDSLRLAQLQLDCLIKPNARAIILDLDAINEDTGFEQHGILGGDFLSNFRVQIDMRRYQMRLTPQTSSIEQMKDTTSSRSGT